MYVHTADQSREQFTTYLYMLKNGHKTLITYITTMFTNKLLIYFIFREKNLTYTQIESSRGTLPPDPLHILKKKGEKKIVSPFKSIMTFTQPLNDTILLN